MGIVDFQSALIAGGFTIVGVLAGAFISHRFALIKMAYDTRIIANEKLRDAFNNELAILQRKSINDVETCDLLEGAFIKHQIAVNDFMAHLHGSEASRFYDAWIRYYGYYEEGEKEDTEFFAKYFHHNDPEGRNKAISNIQSVLAFAVPPSVKPWYMFWRK